MSRSAAELAYFLILTFFPVLICVNGFVGLLKLDPVTLLSGIEEFLPRGTLDVVAEYVGYISTNQSTAMLVAGLSATLFSASAAFRALMNIMSDIYERKTYTGIFQIIASVLFSLLFLVTIYLSLVVVLTGGWLFTLVEDFFHLNPGDLPWDWQWIRFPILFCLVLLFVLLVYRISAPRGKPRPPYPHRRHPGLRGPGGRLHPVLLVHRPVLPVLPGVRVPHLGGHPAAVALPVRQQH